MIKYNITKQWFVINKNNFSENEINWIKADLNIYNENNNIFEINLSKNRNYSIYLLREKIDNLFNQNNL